MTVLVLGASGATGRLLAEQLLKEGVHVRVIVRSPDRLPESLKANEQLEVIKATLLDLSDDELAGYVRGCSAVASCLGHNLNLKGIYGQPRKLVTDATRRLCKAIRVNDPAARVKYVLMNTAGNSNRDLDEKVPLGQKIVIGLLRLVLPPHVDNEKAADFLRTEIGQDDPVIKWVAVRPDTLLDDEEVTEYVSTPSPVRSALFNPGKVSRINVAHFMAGLVTNEETWQEWEGRMPVVYGKNYA